MYKYHLILFLCVVNGIFPRGGALSPKDPMGCAANMGSKISLLVYWMTLMKCKIWYMNESIFQNFLKFEQNWLKFKKISEKIRWFCSNLVVQSWSDKWVTFSCKIGICMGLLSNFMAVSPYQNQISVIPHPASFSLQDVTWCCLNFSYNSVLTNILCFLSSLFMFFSNNLPAWIMKL